MTTALSKTQTGLDVPLTNVRCDRQMPSSETVDKKHSQPDASITAWWVVAPAEGGGSPNKLKATSAHQAPGGREMK